MQTALMHCLVALLFVSTSFANDLVTGSDNDNGSGDEKETEVPLEVDCSLEKAAGFCKALIPRFYFNSESKKCEEFNFGGCGGNSNNFVTLEECQIKCGSETDKVASESPRKSLAAEQDDRDVSISSGKRNKTVSVASQISIGAFLISLAATLLIR